MLRPKNALFLISLIAVGGSVAFAQLDGGVSTDASEVQENVNATASEDGSDPVEGTNGVEPRENDDESETKDVNAKKLEEAEALLREVNRDVSNVAGEIGSYESGEVSGGQAGAAAVAECLMRVLTRTNESAPGLKALSSTVSDVVAKLRQAVNAGDDAAVNKAHAELFGEKGGGGYQSVLRRLENEAAGCEGKNADTSDQKDYMETDEAADTRRDYDKFDAIVPPGTPSSATATGGGDPSTPTPGSTQIPPPISGI